VTPHCPDDRRASTAFFLFVENTKPNGFIELA
jgi:hypothetical protein